jgi:outer membrane protein TolC
MRSWVVGLVWVFWATPAVAAPNKLTLPELIAHARRHARVQADEFAIKAARAQAGEARGARFPKITATGFLGPSPRIECVDPACTMTSPTEQEDVNIEGLFGGAKINLVQPLFTFGKLSALSEAAAHAISAATFQKQITENDLVVQAHKAYFGLKLARELIYMLEDGNEQIEKARKQVQKEVEDGKGEKTVQDRLRLETLAAEVSARLLEAREAEAIALAGVRVIANDPGADIDKDSLEPLVYDLGHNPRPYVERARTEGPDLKMAAEKAASVKELARAERNKWWPDLAFAAGLNFARARGVDDPPSAFANDPFNQQSVTLGLALQWTFDPVGQLARWRRARAQAEQAEALVKAAGSLTDVQVQTAHARAASAKQRITAMRQGEKAARGWVASVMAGDAIGVTSPKELADAYVAYFTVRARMLQSVYDWNLAVADLKRYIGERSP